MEPPEGHKDLIADAEDELRRDEAALAAKREAVEKLRLQGEAVVLDEHGNVVPSDAPPVPWPHDVLDFMGEEFEIRRPSAQALAAFSLSSGKYISQDMQNNMVGLFIRNHLSEASHGRVYERMMDPEDVDFTPTTLGDLVREIATFGTARPIVQLRP